MIRYGVTISHGRSTDDFSLAAENSIRSVLSAMTR